MYSPRASSSSTSTSTIKSKMNDIDMDEAEFEEEECDDVEQLSLQVEEERNLSESSSDLPATAEALQSITSQATAALAAAMAAQQLIASAAAMHGIDLASLLAVAQLANQSAGPATGALQNQLQQSLSNPNILSGLSSNFGNLNNNTSNSTNTTTQVSATTQQQQQQQQAALAAAAGLTAFLTPNTLVPEDLTVANNGLVGVGVGPGTTGSSLASLAANNSSVAANLHNLVQLQQLQQQAQLAQQQQHKQQHHQNSVGHRHLLGVAAAAAAAAAANGHHAGIYQNSQQTHQAQQGQVNQHQTGSQQANQNNNSSQANNQNQSQNQNQNHNHNHHHHHHRQHHLLAGHHHHSSIQTQQQLLATKGFNPMAVVVGSGQQTEILTPTHLRKAKLMFFYVRYPSSSVLKECFRDVRFNKNNTAQLVKWFSNFREFYYIQMEKFAREAANDRIQCKEDIVVTYDHELINQLNNHYNKNRHIELPEVFRQVVEETLRHFFDAIYNKRDQEQSWKKAIYKLIQRLDQEVPEVFKTDAFNEHLE